MDALTETVASLETHRNGTSTARIEEPRSASNDVLSHGTMNMEDKMQT